MNFNIPHGDVALQHALYMAVLEDHMEATADPEYNGMNTYEHNSVRPLNTSAI